MRLLALGVGNAFSSRYYSSSFAIEAEGQWLLIDCPHPIRKILREAAQTASLSLKIDQLTAIVLTHLHGDHASGLEGLLFFYRFVLNRKPQLIAHPEVAAKLWTGHLAASMEWTMDDVGQPLRRHEPEEYYDQLSLPEAQPLQVGPFAIQGRKTIHNIPTTALKISAAGRTLGLSADTAFDPTLIDWLKAADFIVHEAGGGFMHTPYEKLLGLPEDLRGRMRLVHYPDRFDVDASAIEPLRQGQIYTV
jgi:ribonuclease BN (tRNA processing enzyme)